MCICGPSRGVKEPLARKSRRSESLTDGRWNLSVMLLKGLPDTRTASETRQTASLRLLTSWNAVDEFVHHTRDRVVNGPLKIISRAVPLISMWWLMSVFVTSRGRRTRLSELNQNHDLTTSRLSLPTQHSSYPPFIMSTPFEGTRKRYCPPVLTTLKDKLTSRLSSNVSRQPESTRPNFLNTKVRL